MVNKNAYLARVTPILVSTCPDMHNMWGIAGPTQDQGGGGSTPEGLRGRGRISSEKRSAIFGG